MTKPTFLRLGALLPVLLLAGCSPTPEGKLEIRFKAQAPVQDLYLNIGDKKEYYPNVSQGRTEYLLIPQIPDQAFSVSYKAGERQESAVGPVLDAKLKRVEVTLEAPGDQHITFKTSSGWF